MATVISIGSFAGNSFGVPGNPSKTYEYFAVQGDTEGGFPRQAFRDRTAAEKHAAEVQRKRDAAAAKREAIAVRNTAALTSVRDALKAAKVFSRLEKIAGVLLTADRMTAESAAAVAALQHGNGDWDALTEDGRIWRVCLPHPFAGGGGVAQIVLAT